MCRPEASVHLEGSRSLNDGAGRAFRDCWLFCLQMSKRGQRRTAALSKAVQLEGADRTRTPGAWALSCCLFSWGTHA